MTFDATIKLGDVIMAIIAIGLLPAMKLLISTLVELREGLTELRMVVVGSSIDHSGGMVGDVSELKRDHIKLRNWLIKICAEQGLKIEDRT